MSIPGRASGPAGESRPAPLLGGESGTGPLHGAERTDQDQLALSRWRGADPRPVQAGGSPGGALLLRRRPAGTGHRAGSEYGDRDIAAVAGGETTERAGDRAGVRHRGMRSPVPGLRADRESLLGYRAVPAGADAASAGRFAGRAGGIGHPVSALHPARGVGPAGRGSARGGFRVVEPAPGEWAYQLLTAGRHHGSTRGTPVLHRGPKPREMSSLLAR